MKSEKKHATGTVRYRDGILTISTNAKRGKKTVVLSKSYAVKDLGKDEFGLQSYSLTKECGEAYCVSDGNYGPSCSCPHYTFRGSSGLHCKHVLAMRAVGFLPKPNGKTS